MLLLLSVVVAAPSRSGAVLTELMCFHPHSQVINRVEPNSSSQDRYYVRLLLPFVNGPCAGKSALVPDKLNQFLNVHL